MMSLSSYVVPDVHYLLRKAIGGFSSILDVGCGAEHAPLRYMPRAAAQLRVGIDHFAPSIHLSRQAKIHDEYICDDIFAFAKSRHREYECVIALDIIEHFEKPDGFKFLAALEQIATKRVVVLTPNGFLPQEPYDGNESQRHLSGWSLPEFERLGYRVFGAYGLKALRGTYAAPRIAPKIIGYPISLLSQFFVVRSPAFAFSLFAVKDIVPVTLAGGHE